MSIPINHSSNGRGLSGGYCSFSYSGNSLERFEESLSKLNLPRWMNRKAENYRTKLNGETGKQNIKRSFFFVEKP